MKKRRTTAPCEMLLNNDLDFIKNIIHVSKSQKKLVFIAVMLATSFLLLIGFIALYYISWHYPDLTTVSIAGMMLAGTIFVFSIMAGLISFGTYCTYFIINLNKKEMSIAETMAEMSLLIRIISRVKSNAPQITESVLIQNDIASELNKYPALKERIFIDNTSSNFNSMAMGG